MLEFLLIYSKRVSVHIYLLHSVLLYFKKERKTTLVANLYCKNNVLKVEIRHSKGDYLNLTLKDMGFLVS
jgi:hypothetical protein